MTQIIIEHPQWAGRNVTLIVGPPGCGKSTLARTLHANVLELEGIAAPDHVTRLRQFGKLAYRIGRSPYANHAVVRCCITLVEREHHEQLCRPARTIVLATPADVCHARVTERNRPDAASEHDGIDRWWSGEWDHA